MNLRSVVIIAVILFSCKEKSNTIVSPESAVAFSSFEKSLEKCKSGSVDSILLWSQKNISGLSLENRTTKIWQAYSNARILMQKGFYREAIPYINNALPLTEDYPYSLEQARLFDIRGSINENLNNSLAAATDLYQAAEIYTKLEKFPDAASCYLSTCNIQYNSGNYELAIKDGLQAFDFFSRNKKLSKTDSTNSINAYNTLGLANFHLHKLDSATKYFNLASQYAILSNNKLWIGLVTGNSAKIDIEKGHTQIAVKKLKQKLTACLNYREYAAAGAALISLAEIEIHVSNLDRAKQLYDSAWILMKREKNLRIQAAYYQSVSTWYEVEGDYQQAHTYTKKYMALRDSIQGGNPVSAQLLQIQSKNQFKKQLADFSLLKAENELKNQELKVWQISIVAIIIISILLAILLNTINKNYKKLNELNGQLESKVKSRTIELMKINKELDTYLYRSSHDVRRPILSIIGLTQLTNLVEGEDELREIQGKIEDTAQAMDKMLRKLQMAYELDKIFNNETIDLSDYLKGLVFTTQRMYPKIQFEFKSSINNEIESNTKLLDIIFINLLENACIFSVPGRPRVGVEIQQIENTISIHITDNGIGIDKMYWTEIFKPYTRFSEQSIGSGLGLHLAEKGLQKMNGLIHVKSTLYKGSEFIVTIPAY
ncbi:MAG: ATP-binding protein [Chryseolinea sp.]